MTVEVLFLALVAVMGITTVLLGSWQTAATVTGVCLLAVLNVMGIMGYWHISLNAISLVNLVISLGIAVEFCSHIARAFMGAGQGLPYDHRSGSKERDERAQAALVDVGPAVSLVPQITRESVSYNAQLQVFSGITMTKLIGISVLALTRSKLLEVSAGRYVLTSKANLIAISVDLLFPDVACTDHLRSIARAHPSTRCFELYRRAWILFRGE